MRRRRRRRRRRRARRDGPGEAVDADVGRSTCRLASCTHRLPGPTITSTRATVSRAVGQRGDRLGAAHAVDLVDAAQRAGAEHDRVDLAAAARAASTTTTSSTPATRAVTAPITTVDGYGARPPGT